MGSPMLMGGLPVHQLPPLFSVHVDVAALIAVLRIYGDTLEDILRPGLQFREQGIAHNSGHDGEPVGYQLITFPGGTIRSQFFVFHGLPHG